MSISPPITRAPAAVILFVAIALVQTLSATAAAVAIRPPSVFLAIDMPATVTPPKARLWHGRIDQAIADDGFTDLQTMYNGTGRSSGKKGGPSATKGDKKLQGSKLLFQTHERLGAVIEMLEQFAKDVNNPQVANRTELKRSAKKIKTYAVPMLKSSRSTEQLPSRRYPASPRSAVHT
ncbi:hypothetical protein THAOC_01081 [Thalassiosira oceanica]|uniref:RxLR effector protein n=1 Tax=Thalassiosira oceanica TaxID=159749 RepID=K0TJ41_THAOC|nr:hypothetical protein THAOC_01081 [Thalassiosira oceanica]|eukprot:EJK77109.1 hypothetical protein THAOC_01081 [Thalassiosira oceanica]